METVLAAIPTMAPAAIPAMVPAAILAMAPAAIPITVPEAVLIMAPAAVLAEVLAAGEAVLAVPKAVLEYMEMLIQMSEKERADAGKSFRMDGFSIIQTEEMQKMSGAIYIMVLQAERTGIVSDRTNI